MIRKWFARSIVRCSILLIERWSHWPVKCPETLVDHLWELWLVSAYWVFLEMRVITSDMSSPRLSEANGRWEMLINRLLLSFVLSSQSWKLASWAPSKWWYGVVWCCVVVCWCGGVVWYCVLVLCGVVELDSQWLWLLGGSSIVPATMETGQLVACLSLYSAFIGWSLRRWRWHLVESCCWDWFDWQLQQL